MRRFVSLARQISNLFGSDYGKESTLSSTDVSVESTITVDVSVESPIAVDVPVDSTIAVDVPVESPIAVASEEVMVSNDIPVIVVIPSSISDETVSTIESSEHIIEFVEVGTQTDPTPISPSTTTMSSVVEGSTHLPGELPPTPTDIHQREAIDYGD